MQDSREPEEPDEWMPHGRVEFDGGESGPAPAPFDPHWSDLSALVARAERNRAEMARLEAERAEICADAVDLVAMRVAQRRAARPGRELGDTIPLREVLAELAAALHVTERTVSTWLGDGAALVSTYTATLRSLREGRIDDRHASAITDAGAPLSPENRAEYERLILPIAEVETASAVREHARIIAARLQPDIVEENQRRALAERRVRAFDLEDGIARLLVDGPAALIHGIYERVTDMAATPDPCEDADPLDEPSDPDERTLDQKRADVVCDLLLTAAPTADGDVGLGGDAGDGERDDPDHDARGSG